MRLHRFFVSSDLEVGKRFTIEEENLVHQLRSVFRYKPGDEIILLNNTNSDFVCTITDMKKDLIEVEVLNEKESPAKIPLEIYLFASLIKKDNYEWVLEKCTELGVSHFVPVVSARTEKKDLNMERAMKIVTEASEQSGRGTVPVLYAPLSIGDAYEAFAGEKIDHIAFDGSGKKFDAGEFNKSTKIGIWIGPEGGWSDDEISAFKELKIPLVKIGSGQTLRAETAAVSISSLFLI